MIDRQEVAGEGPVPGPRASKAEVFGKGIGLELQRLRRLSFVGKGIPHAEAELNSVAFAGLVGKQPLYGRLIRAGNCSHLVFVA